MTFVKVIIMMGLELHSMRSSQMCVYIRTVRLSVSICPGQQETTKICILRHIYFYQCIKTCHVKLSVQNDNCNSCKTTNIKISGPESLPRELKRITVALFTSDCYTSQVLVRASILSVYVVLVRISFDLMS
jgi:hypothetical protein